jgi:hypothetical protein
MDDECDFDDGIVSEEEKVWREYSMQRLELEENTVALLVEKLKQSQPLHPSLTSLRKDALIDLLFPVVPKPSGLLSFQKLNESDDDDDDDLPPAPRAIEEADLLLEPGKYKTVKQLKPLLEERCLPTSGLKDVLLQKLREYKPEHATYLFIRKRKREAKENIMEARFANRPRGDSIMRALYDQIQAEIIKLQTLQQISEAEALTALRPHMLQHLDNSFNYHILVKRDKGRFDFHYRNGIKHWQSIHIHCARKHRCPQKGVIGNVFLIPILTDILQNSSQMIDLETESVWDNIIERE